MVGFWAPEHKIPFKTIGCIFINYIFGYPILFNLGKGVHRKKIITWISTYVVLPPPFYSLVEEMNSGQQKGLNSAIQNVLKHMVSRLFQRLKFYIFFKKCLSLIQGKNIKTLILFLKHCVTTSLILMMKKRGLLSFWYEGRTCKIPLPPTFY